MPRPSCSSSSLSSRRASTRSLLASGLLALAGASHAAAQVVGAEFHGTPGGLFGQAVANAGDVDADGADDLIVGERSYSTPAANCGRACVYSGRTAGLIREHVGSQTSEACGTAAAGIGDLDADGFADYVIGFERHDTANADAGMIVAFSGATGAVLWTAFGTAVGDGLGNSLAALDDLDGDGRREVIAGLRNRDEARIFDGAGVLLASITGKKFSLFGFSVGRAGDLDGDGIGEFLVGAPDWGGPALPDRGRVDVYSGATQAPLFAFLGDSAGDFLGVAVTGIGDVDGDGIEDLCGGAPNSSTAAANAGYLRVARGSNHTKLRTEYGTKDDLFGFAVTRLGDVDHDGIDDYAASGPGGGAASVGEVRVLAGSDGSLLWSVEGGGSSTGSNGALGYGITGGDFNGDGIGDVAIGDPYFADSTGMIGGAWIHLGCPAWSESYGAGWPGQLGVPGLVALDDPGIGASVRVQLDDSTGAGTGALLLIGLADANVPTSAGGTLLVAPLLAVPVALPIGGAVLTGTLPNDPALCFVDVWLQALEADPAASRGLSFTAGLRLRCGFDL